MMLGAALQAQDQPAPRRDPAIEFIVADAASLAAGIRRRRADSCRRRCPGSTGPGGVSCWTNAYMRAYGAPEQYRRADDSADSARQPSGRAGVRLRDRADTVDAAGPRRGADDVCRSASRARAVRVDGAQSGAGGLRRSAGPVGGRVLRRARTDRAHELRRQFRRRRSTFFSCTCGGRICRRRCRRSRARFSAFRAA